MRSTNKITDPWRADCPGSAAVPFLLVIGTIIAAVCDAVASGIAALTWLVSPQTVCGVEKDQLENVPDTEASVVACLQDNRCSMSPGSCTLTQPRALPLFLLRDRQGPSCLDLVKADLDAPLSIMGYCGGDKQRA